MNFAVNRSANQLSEPAKTTARIGALLKVSGHFAGSLFGLVFYFLRLSSTVIVPCIHGWMIQI
jgi:hypothetical protein